MTKLQPAEQSRGCSTAVQTLQGVRQMTNLGGDSPTGGGNLPGHFKETTRCADNEIWMDVPTCYVQTRRLELNINVLTKHMTALSKDKFSCTEWKPKSKVTSDVK